MRGPRATSCPPSAASACASSRATPPPSTSASPAPSGRPFRARSPASTTAPRSPTSAWTARRPSTSTSRAPSRSSGWRARATTSSAWCCHSTAQVSGNRRGTVLEDELQAGQSFRTVVEETKARAETHGARGDGRAAHRGRAPVDDRGRLAERARSTASTARTCSCCSSSRRLPSSRCRCRGAATSRSTSCPSTGSRRPRWRSGATRARAARRFTWSIRDPLSARRVFELVARAGGAPRAARVHPRQPGQGAPARPGARPLRQEPARVPRHARRRPSPTTRATRPSCSPALGVPSCPPFESYVDRLVEFVQERVRQRRASREAAELEAPDPLG